MEGTEPRIPDNSRVKLRDHIAPEFYAGMARSGAEGWIRGHRKDRNGLPECYIEWDREHWADNAQPDRWTYEEHFDVLEEGDGKSTMGEEEMTPEELAVLRKMMRKMMTDDEPAPQDAESEQRALFVEQAARGKEILQREDIESFMLIGILRQDDPEGRAPKGILSSATAYASLTPETDVLLGMQMGDMADRFHKDSAMQLIQHITSE